MHSAGSDSISNVKVGQCVDHKAWSGVKNNCSATPDLSTEAGVLL